MSDFDGSHLTFAEAQRNVHENHHDLLRGENVEQAKQYDDEATDENNYTFPNIFIV